MTFEKVLEVFNDYLNKDGVLEVVNTKRGYTAVSYTHLSPQNGVILLVIAFLVSPLGLPMAAVWLVGKVQDPVSYTHLDVYKRQPVHG